MGGSGRDSGGLQAGARAGSAAPLARSRCDRGTRRLPRSIVALCLAVLGLLLSSTPALASSDVEHVFSRSFKGEEHCKFFLPRGLAVNEATGEVYVYDHFNNSIDRLSSTGACLT